MTSATIQPVQINGAKYSALDTQDGFFVVRDVPIMSEVPKGTKNAPENIGKDWMEKELGRAANDYQNGNFARPLHIGHNKVFELSDPAFAGYYVPKRVGKYKFANGEKWALFADLKLTASAFEKAVRGELPYISPEVDYKDGITSVSFLNSKPPHFEFALFTIGQVIPDASARFSAKFQADDEEKKDGEKEKPDFKPEDKEKPGDEKEESKKPEKMEAKCCAHCAAYGEAIQRITNLIGIKSEDDMNGDKPTPGPVEPEADKKDKSDKLAKMGKEVDPEMAAKFAAQEDRLAAIEKEREAEKAEKKASALAEKALAGLRGYQIGEKVKAGIMAFAKEGEEKLNQYIETIKEIAQKDPPKTVEDFEMSTVSPSDPVLAQFSKSPADLEKATKAAAEYRALKGGTKGFTLSEEQYVKFRMAELG